MRSASISVIAFLAIATPAASLAGASCESLAKTALPKATITTAAIVEAGAYKLQTGGGAQVFVSPGMNVSGRAQLDPNPSFCRVAATLKPSNDSDIKIEVWLPQSGWNGKFLAVGNFGWGGSIMTAGMLTGLEAGYATASTDTGHDQAVDGNGGKFSLGHPEKIIDYAYRADHEMVINAKALIKAFYGSAPKHSYWIGCSLGGVEGLIEAKRYPADFDGIVAGAPPNPITEFNAAQLWPSWLIAQDPDRAIPREKFTLVHDAAVKACASPVGLKDGVIDEPDKCSFDPKALQCAGADGQTCLTPAQVFLMQQIYQGPINPTTKKILYPGPARGSELGLGGFASNRPFGTALDLFRYTAFQNADWDSLKMDFDKDVAAADARVGPLLHVDADLKPFFARGGKLLMYIGWNDYHNPIELIDYYKALMRNAGDQTRKSARLFTIPGMNHCLGGEGCDTFDKLGVINEWAANGKAPERIVASKFEKGALARTRPLCAYPEVAKYRGTGDTNAAASFVCVRE